MADSLFSCMWDRPWFKDLRKFVGPVGDAGVDASVRDAKFGPPVRIQIRPRFSAVPCDHHGGVAPVGVGKMDVLVW